MLPAGTITSGDIVHAMVSTVITCHSVTNLLILIYCQYHKALKEWYPFLVSLPMQDLLASLAIHHPYIRGVEIIMICLATQL